jgi:hypothetical protein
MRAVLICVAISLLSAACSDEPPKDLVERAKKAVTAKFADPYSAVFEDLYLTKAENGDTILCGTVNAKNLVGAYTGRRRFIYIDTKQNAYGAVEGEEPGELNAYCKQQPKA